MFAVLYYSPVAVASVRELLFTGSPAVLDEPRTVSRRHCIFFCKAVFVRIYLVSEILRRICIVPAHYADSVSRPLRVICIMRVIAVYVIAMIRKRRSECVVLIADLDSALLVQLLFDSSDSVRIVFIYTVIA